MLLQHVTLTVREGQENAFEAALVEVRQRVFSCAGFRGLSVLQDAEHPAVHLVQVRWETAEELAEVAASGRLERAWAPVLPFLVEPPRVDHFVERPNLDARGPGVVTDLSWAQGTG